MEELLGLLATGAELWPQGHRASADGPRPEASTKFPSAAKAARPSGAAKCKVQ